MDVAPTAAELKRMKVAELRDECTRRGLDASGTKVVLISRLEAALVSGGGEKRKADDAPAPPPVKKEKSKGQMPPVGQIKIGKQDHDLSPQGELTYLGKLPKNVDEMRKLLQGIEALPSHWVKTLTFPHGIVSGTGAFLCDYLMRGCPSVTGLKINEEFGENCADDEERMVTEGVGRLLRANRLELLDLSGVGLGFEQSEDNKKTIDALVDGIAASSSLQHLCLSRCSLVGSSAAARLLDAILRKPAGLYRLELHQCAFRTNDTRGTPAGPPLVALVDSGKLEHLDIRGAYGDPPTMIGLFGSIAEGGSKLKTLSIHGADGGLFSNRPPMVPGQRGMPEAVPSEEALAAVARAVGKSTSLEDLDLGDCHVLASDETAAQLATSLKESAPAATLQRLCLTKLQQVVVGPPVRPIVAKKGFGTDGLEALLAAVDGAPSLQRVELSLPSRHGLPQATVDALMTHKKIVCDRY